MTRPSGRVHSGHDGRIFWVDRHKGAERDGITSTACEDGSIGLWRDTPVDNLKSVSRKKLFAKAHSEEVLRLKWDVGGRDTLYSGGSDGFIKSWKYDDDDLRITLESEASVLSNRDDEGQVYAIFQTGEPETPHSASSASGSPGLVGVAFDNAVTLFDKNGLLPLLSWRYHPHSQGVAPIGGPRNPGNKAFVFDTATLGGTEAVGHGNLVMAALSDGSVRLRDMRCPLRDVSAIVAHAAYATCCASDGTHYVASGGGDGSANIFDVRTWQPLVQTQANALLYGVGFWPTASSGETAPVLYCWTNFGDVIFASGSTTRRVRCDIRKHKRGLAYPIYCATAAADGKSIAVCGGTTPEPEPSGPSKGRGLGKGGGLGLRSAPSFSAGCVRVNESKEDRLNPWMSIRLSVDMTHDQGPGNEFSLSF